MDKNHLESHPGDTCWEFFHNYLQKANIIWSVDLSTSEEMYHKIVLPQTIVKGKLSLSLHPSLFRWRRGLRRETSA